MQTAPCDGDAGLRKTHRRRRDGRPQGPLGSKGENPKMQEGSFPSSRLVAWPRGLNTSVTVFNLKIKKTLPHTACRAPQGLPPSSLQLPDAVLCPLSLRSLLAASVHRAASGHEALAQPNPRPIFASCRPAPTFHLNGRVTPWTPSPILAEAPVTGHTAECPSGSRPRHPGGGDTCAWLAV